MILEHSDSTHYICIPSKINAHLKMLQDCGLLKILRKGTGRLMGNQVTAQENVLFLRLPGGKGGKGQIRCADELGVLLESKGKLHGRIKRCPLIKPRVVFNLGCAGAIAHVARDAL